MRRLGNIIDTLSASKCLMFVNASIAFIVLLVLWITDGRRVTAVRDRTNTEKPITQHIECVPNTPNWNKNFLYLFICLPCSLRLAYARHPISSNIAEISPIC
jgi:hypothetical protein